MVNLVCANFGNDSWRFGYILVNFWSRPHPALFPVRSARGSLLFLVLVSGAGSQVRWRLSQFCYQRRALRRRACSLEQHLSLARTLLNFLQTARGHQQSVRSPSGQERPQLYSFSKQVLSTVRILLCNTIQACTLYLFFALALPNELSVEPVMRACFHSSRPRGRLLARTGWATSARWLFEAISSPL
ncbi:uncharacterized protein LOC110432416 isoform X2 [Sorghum bicolor]|uniref:uncharacterized protein LOC110432416 isoform X2 n=1 Tax=Sorghum bicolor TaxID=4558 RepID=UPI000B426AFC|nr:uncharacterized protein LOC110432416 isoform X2 [Sorghum bicolor]|eukprot:XP_021308474.1 uncharacterized protein LOC110432416 isoform X2 [Sorghum bicolor]